MLQQKNLEIARQSNELRIVYRWRNAMAYGLLVFALIWNGMLLPFILVGAGWGISLHVLVGLGVGYLAITRLFNRTVITVNRRELTVAHGPVPSFSRNRTVRSSEVKQLFLKRSGSVKSGNKVTPLYSLLLRTGAEDDVKLLGGIQEEALGKTIERSVEEYLDITDIPVEDKLSLDDLGILKKYMPEEMKREFTRRVGEMQASEPRPPETTAPPVSTAETVADTHDHFSYDFDLCHAPVGSTFTLKDVPHRLRDTTRILWRGGGEVRVLKAVPLAEGPDRQYYAYRDGDQWAYYEERSLDAGERESLDFDGVEAPASLRNGDERFHLLANDRGILYDEHGEHSVDQWIYYSSRSSTRFRALRRERGHWTVAIQEPFDSSYIEAME